MTSLELDTAAGQGAPWLPEHVPDRTRLVTLPWGRAFAVDVGPAPDAPHAEPLVMLHGFFVTHHAFSKLIPLVAEQRRVVALDLPGTGDSDRPNPEYADDYALDWLGDAVALALDALDVSRCTLLAHDFGGAIALALASRRPELFSKLVLLSPLALAVSLPLQGTLAIAPSLGIDVFRRALRKADLQGFLEQGLSTPELLEQGDLHVFWDRLCRAGGREATYAMLTQLPSVVRLRERISSLELPVTLVWGDRDTIAPPDQAERLAALLPKATAHVLDGCGHNPAFERPAAVAEFL